MWGAIQNLFRVETIRTKIFITLGLLFIARIGLNIPLPGVNYGAYKAYVESQSGVSQFVGLFNALSGGNIQSPMLFALGILPYITSSIIFSLLVKVLPSLEALSKEGASGQKKINQYSRMLTVPICIFQGSAICYAIFQQMAANSPDIVPGGFGFGFVATAVLGMTAGTIFLMWLGEQITAHGIGNGVSLLIVAGIVTGLPGTFVKIIDNAQQDRSYILVATVLLAVYFAMVIGIVYMTKGQRRIPIQQAKLMKGRRMMGGSRHYLPVKLNMANVMPVIFASALLTLPVTIISWVFEERFNFYGGWWYVTLFSGLIMFFSFFWTSLMFQPTEMANNLKEYGSFVPGIRPGKKTAEFLEKVMTHITLVGSVCLTMVAVIPLLITQGLNLSSIVAGFMGGTGILIVVGVTLDLVDQLNASLLQRNYEGFMSASAAKKGSRR
ncbi:MAG: preprotein translocase subunit SecY [Planctomycetes bacterium]|nr:preprotein translocase subunit SecY [Planctomycetota bacterium]